MASSEVLSLLIACTSTEYCNLREGLARQDPVVESLLQRVWSGGFALDRLHLGASSRMTLWQALQSHAYCGGTASFRGSGPHPRRTSSGEERQRSEVEVRNTQWAPEISTPTRTTMSLQALSVSVFLHADDVERSEFSGTSEDIEALRRKRPPQSLAELSAD
jgi:hypothetical protein